MLISRPPSMVTMGRTSTPGSRMSRSRKEIPSCGLTSVSVRTRQNIMSRPVCGGCPGLGPVDDVVVAVTDRAGAQARQIGPCVRLRVALAPPRLVRGDGRQVLRLLRVAAEGADHRADHLRPEGHDPRCSRTPHLLLEDVALHRRPARPAVLHRPRIDEPAPFGQYVLPAVVVVLAEREETLDLRADVGRKPLFDNRAHLVLEVAQLVRELQVHRPLPGKDAASLPQVVGGVNRQSRKR